MQITKNLSVSIDLPGPTKSSHQPGLDDVAVSTSLPPEATWEDAERPVCRMMALERDELSLPHVSKAMVYSGRGWGE